MKNHYCKLLLVLLLPFYGFGQTSNVITKNAINIDPFIIAFGTVQMQYERSINDKMSVSISIGGKFSSGLFRLKGIDADRIQTDDFNFKGIKILPEFRWYVQKQAVGTSGFYIGAYAKYQDYTDEILGNYVDVDGTDYDVIMDTSIQTFAVGFQIGYKLRLIDRLFFDFIIAGPGVSFNTFELKEKEPIPDAFYSDLSNALSEYFVFDSLDPDFEIDANTKSDKIALPAFRYGIKLGYAF